MLKFSEFLLEARKKTAILLFGRMNPLTKGHEENVRGAAKLGAENDADVSIVASRSQDPKKNPLSPTQKIRYLRKAFPGMNVHVAGKDAPTIMSQAAKLHKKGYEHLIVVGGGDRAQEYHDLLHKYNGQDYNFKSIRVMSTGERKKGVSGTDMRSYAAHDTFSKFREGLPPTLANDPEVSHRMFRDTQRGMRKSK